MNNILIKGGPATGKTIISRAMAYYIGCAGLDVESVYTKDIQADMSYIEAFIQSDRVEYIQIHPSMTYEDIVYGVEVRSGGTFSMDYAEKRIKQLCDRAKGQADKFFVILDDIGRTNPGSLLGNLLYALEYRNEPVGLCDGTELVIPENVYFIVTECKTLYGEPLEYVIRRRFDYEKELLPSAEVLENYYSSLTLTKGIVQNVFETMVNFIHSHILRDPSIQRENYVPGHGMLMVDRAGTEIIILSKIKQKFIYQVLPYIVDLMKRGIIVATEAELNSFSDTVVNQINVGYTSITTSATVNKIFYQSKTAITTFGLADSQNYYQHTIIPNGCKEHRAIIENIIDAILTNEIFTVDKALSDILLNTNSVRFEHRTMPRVYAAYLVEASQNSNFGYLTTVSNNVRSYYSSNPCRTGRWAAHNDAPAYRITYADGTEAEYISLNAFRNTGFDVTEPVIHAYENTASIYCALFRLVATYLDAYDREMSLWAIGNSDYEDISKLVKCEVKYWRLKNREAQAVKGADVKFVSLSKAVLCLRTLWTLAGTDISVDESKFNAIFAHGLENMTAGEYEDLYNITGVSKTIEIKGVPTMVDLNDYQKIMENIGVNQMIFQGPPGTSKTFESKKFVLEQLKYKTTGFPTGVVLTQTWISDELQDYKLTDADYDNPLASSKLTTGGWDLVQFHPSYGYEDFIRGIEVKPVGGVPTYNPVDRILGKIAEFAKLAENANPANPPKFYLVVDEINRANLATVFGELIYGLEYRNSPVSTPYEVNSRVSGCPSKDIVLSKNLFIVGTMNTADKSIDSIDYAIRRRFIFIESPAKREVVLSCYQRIAGVTDENSIEVLLFDAVGYIFEGDRFFNVEYQRNDVRLGHTYFLRTASAGYLDTMIEKFVFQVIPILKEYVKDGILDSFEDLKALEHTKTDIHAATDRDRIKMLGENIMLYVKHFGEENASGVVIDNAYIANAIEDLCAELGF